MTRAAKVLLVLTAFAPILITLAFVDLRLPGDRLLGACYVVAAALLAIVCALLLKEVGRRGMVLPIEVQSAKPADKEMMAFILAYLLPLTNTGNPARVDVSVLLFVIAILIVIVYATSAFQFNPLIGLLGFHFYDVSDHGVGYVLITRRRLRDVADIRAVVEITDYIVLEHADGI
jgi:hypothetical protein